MERRHLDKAKYILFFMSYSGLFIMWITHYRAQNTSSGFFFSSRVPELISATSTYSYDWTEFESFPLSPAYLLVVENTTGLGMDSIIYLPIYSFITAAFFIILFRFIFDDIATTALVAFPVIWYLTAAKAHYTEYYIGYITYPVFVYIFYKYLQSGRSEFLPPLALIFIVLKFFSPHSELWAVSFVVIVAIFLKLRQHRVMEKPNIRGNIYAPVIIVFLVFLAYNPKFYAHLLTLRFPVDPVGHFIEFASFIFSESSSSREEFQTGGFTSRYPRLLNTGYVVTIAGGMVVAGIYEVYSNRLDIGQWTELKRMVVWAGVLGIVPDTLMMVAIGQVQTHIVIIMGVFFVMYVLYQIESPNREVIMIFFLSILIIMSVVSHTYLVFATPSQYQSGFSEDHQAAADWIVTMDNSASDQRYVTDLRAFGILRSNAAVNGHDINRSHQTYVNSKTYTFMYEDSTDYHYDLMIVHEDMYSFPVDAGWTYYEPFSNHEVQNNPSMHRVYDSNTYEVYR